LFTVGAKHTGLYITRPAAIIIAGADDHAKHRSQATASAAIAMRAGHRQGNRGLFSRAARQHCLVHRMRNLTAKPPEDVWPEFKARAQAAYQAPSRAIAGELAAGVVADYGRKYDSAVACFVDDLEACIVHLRFPVTILRRRRTSTKSRSSRFVVRMARRYVSAKGRS
jgi:transposase-like protein